MKVPICPFWHFCSTMHRLAIKRTTKNELPPASHYTRNDVRTAASRHSAVRCDRRYVCRDCRVPTAVHVHRGVRTANLHAVRSAITATAELLVLLWCSGAVILYVYRLHFTVTQGSFPCCWDSHCAAISTKMLHWFIMFWCEVVSTIDCGWG